MKKRTFKHRAIYRKAFMQKLEYIHHNAVAAELVSYAEEYKYSSAKFYFTGTDEFNIVSHYSGN